MRLLLVVAVLFLASRGANAACVLNGARPTEPLPTMELGQEFSFVASPDCETLRFTIRGTAVSENPKSGGPVGPGPHTYKIRLTESEWNAVVAESGSTLTWVVTGRTSAGVMTRMVTTNDLKRDETITLELSMADAKLVGEEPDDHAGYSVSGAGDVDGDGHADLLLGAYGNDAGAGAAYLVRGPVTGTLDLSLADAKLVGDDAFGYEAGYSVSGAGDVDGDGHDDLLIGADGDQEGGGYEAGAAYLVRGPVTGTLDLSLADAKLLGEEQYDLAGFSVSGAGDVDRDGHDDLLVGAPRPTYDGATYAGAAYLVLGPVTGTLDLSLADAKLVGEASADFVGVSVSGAGDVDGDGRDDFLVGAEHEVGAAFLVLGPVTGTVVTSSADAELLGEGDNHNSAGSSVSGAGDVNADGHADLLVGAPWGGTGEDAEAGVAYLVLGPVTGTKYLAGADATFLGDTNSDHAGIVSDAGDVNSDGHDDVLVGATGAGAAYLVLGPVTGTVALSHADAVLGGEGGFDEAGCSVSGAGDVDADGQDDLLVGAHQNDEGGDEAGAAYLVYGGSLF